MSMFLGWLGLLIMVLIQVLQIYSQVCLKRLFLMLEKSVGNESLLLEARSVNKKWGRTKLNWLKLKQTELPNDVAWLANIA